MPDGFMDEEGNNWVPAQIINWYPMSTALYIVPSDRILVIHDVFIRDARGLEYNLLDEEDNEVAAVSTGVLQNFTAGLFVRGSDQQDITIRFKKRGGTVANIPNWFFGGILYKKET